MKTHTRREYKVPFIIHTRFHQADQIKKALPPEKKLEGAAVRLVLEYPRAWDPLIDEVKIRELVADAFEFHFIKQPQTEPRIRLPKDRVIGSLSAEELLEQYWKLTKTPKDEIKELNKLAGEIIHPEADPQADPQADSQANPE